MAKKTGFDGVSVRTEAMHYQISDYGAHALAWQPPGHKPVLWLSQHSKYQAGTAIRGGIPIILPWFGTGPLGDKIPAHGPARIHPWSRMSVEDSVASDGRLCVDYAMTSENHESCPASWIAEYRAEFTNSQLEVALTVINTGSVPFTIEQALHTYLAVGDIKSVTIDGLNQAAYLDKAATATVPARVQEGPVTFTSETDRVYFSRAKVTVTDPVWGRRITVDKTSSANTVIWNPWAEKAATMSDFGDDEWRGMLCVEAANVLDNAVTLAPRGSQVLTQRLHVELL